MSPLWSISMTFPPPIISHKWGPMKLSREISLSFVYIIDQLDLPLVTDTYFISAVSLVVNNILVICDSRKCFVYHWITAVDISSVVKVRSMRTKCR